MADLPNPIVKLTQQELLDLFDRILPDHYMQPLKETGPGYELFQGFAQIGARVSQSVETLGADNQFSTARGGAFSTGTVQLARANALTVGVPIQSGQAASIVVGAGAGNARVSGLSNMSSQSVGHFLNLINPASLNNTGGFEIVNFIDSTTVDIANIDAVVPDSANGSIAWEEEIRTVTVKQGTTVTCSASGRDFVTTEDVTFTHASLGPFTVAVRSIAMGYEYNVPGQVVAADGTVLPGEIDTVKTLIEDPPLGDTTITVSQLVATTGGRDAALDALGKDRGIERGRSEGDDGYRTRVRALPDTVTPMAFFRACEKLLRPLGISYHIIETFDLSYQTCFDAPLQQIPGSNFNPVLFVFDDPDTDRKPFRNRWLDISDYRGGVIVVVQDIQPLADTSMIYDDNVTDAAGYVSPISGGKRACCAYDVPVPFGFGYLLGAYDGFDLPKRSAYKGLYDTLSGIKPGGASVSIELSGQ